MRSSEVIKKVIEPDMPDVELVWEKCVEELYKETEKHEKTNQKKAGRNIYKSIYAGMGLCVAVLLFVIILSAYSNAEAFIACIQTWLHIDQEKVMVGEMKKDSIHIPEDCEEVEYGGEKYLTKSYSSPEELEEDIGKHLEIWRDVEEFKENNIVLNIVEGEYARIIFIYDFLKFEEEKFMNHESEMHSVECYITIPLSESFSMNNIKLEDQFLKDAVLDAQGNLIRYGQNSEYSLLETYRSEHLDTDISVIGKQRGIDIDQKKDEAVSACYLYFVQGGLSYQMNCNTNIETAKEIVEKMR